jgi:hypothetical protein
MVPFFGKFLGNAIEIEFNFIAVCPEQITSVPQSTSVISQDVAAPITAFKPVPIFPSVSELRAAVGANGARPALFDSHDDARQLLSNAELLYLLAGLHNSLDRPTLIKAVEAAAKAAGLLGPETPVDLKHVWHQTQVRSACSHTLTIELYIP